MLARMDVGQIDLDDRDRKRRDRVAQRDRAMGIAAGVDDHRGGLGHRLVEPVDQHALVIGLADVELELVGGGALDQHGVDLGQALGAVNPRLAGSEQVEVGPVQDKNDMVHLRCGRGPSYLPFVNVYRCDTPRNPRQWRAPPGARRHQHYRSWSASLGSIRFEWRSSATSRWSRARRLGEVPWSRTATIMRSSILSEAVE